MPNTDGHVSESRRRRLVSYAVSSFAFLAIVPLFIVSLPYSRWDPTLLAVLVTIAVASTTFATVTTSRKIDISAAGLTFILAGIFLGPAPAVVVAVTAYVLQVAIELLIRKFKIKSILSTTLRGFLSTLTSYAWAALIAAYTFKVVAAGSAGPNDLMFYLGIVCAGIVFDLVNFTTVSGGIVLETRERWLNLVKYDYVPTILPQLMAIMLIVMTAVLYVEVGIVALAAFALIIPFCASLVRATPTAYRFLKQREDVVISEGLKRRQVLGGFGGLYTFYYKTVLFRINARGIREAADLAFRIGRALEWPASRSLRAYELTLFESTYRSPGRSGIQSQEFLGELKEGLLRTYLGERRSVTPVLSEVVDLALAYTSFRYEEDDPTALTDGTKKFIEKIESSTKTIDVVLGFQEHNRAALDALKRAVINGQSDPASVEQANSQ